MLFPNVAAYKRNSFALQRFIYKHPKKGGGVIDIGSRFSPRERCCHHYAYLLLLHAGGLLSLACPSTRNKAEKCLLGKLQRVAWPCCLSGLSIILTPTFSDFVGLLLLALLPFLGFPAGLLSLLPLSPLSHSFSWPFPFAFSLLPPSFPFSWCSFSPCLHFLLLVSIWVASAFTLSHFDPTQDNCQLIWV